MDLFSQGSCCWEWCGGGGAGGLGEANALYGCEKDYPKKSPPTASENWRRVVWASS